jgi:hypothetical protein
MARASRDPPLRTMEESIAMERVSLHRFTLDYLLFEVFYCVCDDKSSYPEGLRASATADLNSNELFNPDMYRYVYNSQPVYR